MLKWEAGQYCAGEIMEEKILVMEGNTSPGLALKEAKSLGSLGLVAVDQGGRVLGACRVSKLENSHHHVSLLHAVKPVDFFLTDKNTAMEDMAHSLLRAPEAVGVVIDSDGKPLGIIDSEELLGKLVTRIQLLSAYLKAVSDTVDEAVTIIDNNGIVTLWNQKAEDLYRTPAKEIIGKNIESFFCSDHLMVTQVMKNNWKVSNTYHQPREGTHILINSSPVVFGDTTLGSISADRNITELVSLYNEMCHFNSPVKVIEEDEICDRADPFRRILGRSKQLKNPIRQSRKVAITDAPVLIRGETGTGKELFAEAIHYSSERRDAQLIIINCGAIPPSLFESELFGYEGGAFTGADRKGKPGQFEIAHGGTIFLDEVGEIPGEMQVKLLRVLQNQVFYRIGGTKPIKIDVRIISATNQNLEEMIEQGRFRRDLFYRLNVFNIEIPPLRERREDIPHIAQFFLREFAKQHRRDMPKLNEKVLSGLLTYSWPGNIRELRNVLERMVILAENGEIPEDSLPDVFFPHGDGDKKGVFKNITEQTERDLILSSLEDARFNVAQATKLLGIPRSTLYYKMKALGIKK